MLHANSSTENIELIEQKLKEAKGSKCYRRLMIIHLSQQGKTVPELSRLFDLCEATIRVYINSFNQKGLEGLNPNYDKIGRSETIPFTKEEWADLLHQSPSQFDKLETGSHNWTQKLLVKYFELYYSISITRSAISKILKRHGFKWKRGKLKVTSPDPLYTVKRERIEGLKKKP